MMVSSFVMVMEPVEPSISGVSFSSLISSSSVKTVALVRTPRSPRMDLRLSPKPGALTAATWSWPRSLLRMQTARASPSMSSAMMTRGRRSCGRGLEGGDDVLNGGDLLFGKQDEWLLKLDLL